MLTRLIHFLFRRHHYWRTASFGEVAELYVSRLLVMLGLSLQTSVGAVYLYMINYSLLQITLIYGAIFLVRLMTLLPKVRLITRFGPKHMIFWSGVLRIPAVIALLFIEQYAVPSLIIFVFFTAIGPSLYEMSYNIDFSKVKHKGHAGKELGVMQIVERIARALGPVLGGVIATLVSPQATFALAIVLLIAAGVPLFHTAEPMKTGRSYNTKRTLRRTHVDGLLARSVETFGWFSTMGVWTLFLATVVFADAGASIYAVIGGLASLSMLVSIVGAWLFGKTIDNNKGPQLLYGAVVIKSLVQAARPFISTPPMVIVADTANELGTTGGMIASLRGMFAAADESDDRVAYFAAIEIGTCSGLLLAVALFAMLLLLFEQGVAMMIFFGIAALYELVMLRFVRYVRT